jgi:erythromycin esterase
MQLKNLIIVAALICALMAGCKKNGSNQQPGNTTEPRQEPWKQALNLDFEDNNLDNWSVGSKGYRVEPDNTEAAGGRQSLKFSFVKKFNRKPFGFASASLPLEVFRGKRVRLSGSLKTKDVSDYFSLWIRADAGEDPICIANLPGRGPHGTTGWKQYTLEMDVPEKTTLLRCGAALSGEGNAWADEFSIEAVPAMAHSILTIGGKVRDRANNAVPGAVIIAKAILHESATACTTSDKDGNFQLKIPPGVYRLTASAPGLTANSLDYRYFNRDVNDLEFSLGGEGFTINGVVKTSSPLPGETYVIANKLQYIDSLIFYTKPKADGSFSIKVPFGEAYKLDLDSPGLLAVPIMTTKAAASPTPSFYTLNAFAPAPAPEEAVSWIKQEAVSIETPEPGKGYADLQPLKKIIGTVRVIGLGESSHGQREIFLMKHKLLEFLVEEMGFTVFAIELPWPDALAVNRYVLDGQGDPQEALAGFFYWIWKTEEVLAQIRWMRQYNANPAHKKKVKFYGLDITNSWESARRLSLYLETVDPPMANQVAETLTVLKQPRVYSIVWNYTEQQRSALKQSLRQLLKHVDDNKDACVSASSMQEWVVARQHVRYLGQFLEYALTDNDYDGINIRDQGMADTVKWILDTEPPGTKIVLWAHNFHISKNRYPGLPFVFLGIHLKQMLGDDYLPVGFVFNEGGFQALDRTISNPQYNVAKQFSVGPYPGSYGAAMARTGMTNFFLDLREIPRSGVVGDWFSNARVLKWIDSIYAGEKDIKYMFRLPEIFDAAIFIHTTTRARPLPSGRRPPFP